MARYIFASPPSYTVTDSEPGPEAPRNGRRSVITPVRHQEVLHPPHPFSKVHVDHPDGPQLLSLCVRSLLYQRRRARQPVWVVCVGTDRSTGDAFGPLVGTRLTELAPPGVVVRGTLDQPVHATNLHEFLAEVEREKPRPFIIAVDACLGRPESVGFLSMRDRPLQPGSGVNKQLPEVGDLHMIGIVNVGGFMEYFVLQSTRLHLVMRMAEAAARALHQALVWESMADTALPQGRPATARE